MAGYLAIGLILIFFLLSIFTRKFQSWRGMPYIYGALMVFFLVNALINREQLYPNLIFFIVALGLVIKSWKRVKTSN
jgi:NhaP-type Na+/H+ and K+/H+ antiporter